MLTEHNRQFLRGCRIKPGLSGKAFQPEFLGKTNFMCVKVVYRTMGKHSFLAPRQHRISGKTMALPRQVERGAAAAMAGHQPTS